MIMERSTPERRFQVRFVSAFPKQKIPNNKYSIDSITQIGFLKGSMGGRERERDFDLTPIKPIRNTNKTKQ
jgi:hypothetical protein